MNNILIMVSALLCINVAQAQSFSGKTQWAKMVDITSSVSSTVKVILVKEGQLIAQDDDLVLLDNSILTLNFKIAQSRLAALSPIMNLADMDLNRAFELHDRELLTDVALKNAEFKFSQTKAEYDSAQASQDKAEFLLNSANIKSPINGRVLSINKSVGFFSDSEHAASLITLVKHDQMHAVAYLKVSQWNDALVGKQAVVTLQNKQYKGVVESLSLSPVDSSKGISVYPIVIRFTPNKLIPSGMPLTIEIK